MEKTSWADCVRNEGVLRRVKEERNILQTTKRRKAKWNGHFLCRNCLLKLVIIGKVEGRIGATGRRGIRGRQLVDDLKQKIGYSKVKVEALDSTVWRTCFGRGYWLEVRQTADRMSEYKRTV